MDCAQILKLNKTTKEDINNLKDYQDNINNLYYKSNKITISQGKIYNSKAAYLSNIPFEGKPIKIIDIAEFWEEAKYI